MNNTSTGTDNFLGDNQVMLKAVKFANLINESALQYRNWKDAEKAFEQAANEYNRGKPQFQNFPILREKLEKKKSTAERALSTVKATHDIKAKILTDCCKDLLSDRLSIMDVEDIVVTAREVISGRDLEANEQKLLDQCKTYIDSALARERPIAQVDLSEVHAELQRLATITERQDATIKEQRNAIERIVTKHNSEIEVLRKELQEIGSSSRSEIATITGVVQDVRTELQLAQTKTEDSLLKVVSSVDNKIQELAADMQEFRVICDKLAGFDKVSEELQAKMEQSIGELRKTTQEHIGALLKVETVLNEHQEYINNSKNDNSSSQEESGYIPPSQRGTETHSLSGLDHDNLQDLTTRVFNTEERLSEHQIKIQVEVDSMHTTIDTIGRNIKEWITQSLQGIQKEMSRFEAETKRLETLINFRREEKVIEPTALQSQYREQFSIMDSKYDAVITSLIHLNKRIDDFSVDSVVNKLNMQIRNVNHDQLQALVVDLRKLREFVGMTDAAGNVRSLEQPLVPNSRLNLVDVIKEVEYLRSSLHRMNVAWGHTADDIGQKIDRMETRMQA